MESKNALICLGGGPSPVINASLQGVIERCFDYPDKIAHVYCAHHGIEGVLLEELMAKMVQNAKKFLDEEESQCTQEH